MGTFEQDLWDIPSDVPSQVEAETKEWYRVPAGIYSATFGRINPKYKDMNGKGCDSDYPGAIFDHASIPLWLIETHGTPEKPQQVAILGKDLQIPPVRKVQELYYPMFISWKKEDQWKNVALFNAFELPGVPESKVILTNPANPQKKIVNFKALPKYYGMVVRFNLVMSDKGNVFVDSKSFPMTPTGERISLEKMKAFEEAINIKVEAERQERNANQSQSGGGSYTPPADSGEDSSNLDDFLQ